MRKIQTIITGIALGCSIATFAATPKLNDGIWRGTLEVKDNSAPFLFEVSHRGADSTVVTLMNGEERVALNGVFFKGDSVIIPIEPFDAQIRAAVTEGTLSGRFLKNYVKNDVEVRFAARFDNKQRFEQVATPTAVALDGKWDVLFIDPKGEAEHNVGIFQTDNGIITGSVLTPSGDLRFLEGAYTQTGAHLSAFAGQSPYLLEVSFKDNNHFEGTFFTTKSKTRLEGTRNDKAGLADPYNQTHMKPGKDHFGFSLPNTDGKKVSLTDERYGGKVVIVSILGSWCPNCMDEMKYLAPWYKANKGRGVEVVGLAFERKDDFDYARAALLRMKKRYGTEYELLFGGQVGSEATGKALPEMDKVASYPTMIFIDKKGKVRKIHTGFNGPATGLFYKEFQHEFNVLVDELLAE
ncbi:TlpA disulfide reductase family protein [Paludibacter sp.]|uniref:TlpA disulfide reductase family protein n=1 Tax=Paludibacter sp. TaxID=1898105 RepID=UPI0013533B59|nr:TlpA disulfide reductase family protein [Paludibacter sp.]MTK52253.1 TlpA family protein disulfide reductase [Paludibacter sp.]